MRWLRLTSMGAALAACGGNVVVDGGRQSTGGAGGAINQSTTTAPYDGGTCGCTAPNACVHACCGLSDPAPHCAVRSPEMECSPSGDCIAACECVGLASNDGGAATSSSSSSSTSGLPTGGPYDGGTCGCRAPDVCVHGCCSNVPECVPRTNVVDLVCSPTGDCYGVCACIR